MYIDHGCPRFLDYFLLNYGIIPNFTVFSGRKIWRPYNFANSLNISRNALFLNIEAVSEEILNIFPIGSYVKTMSADGSHLGWRAGSSDTILKGDHLRIIPTKFGPNYAKPLSEEEDF